MTGPTTATFCDVQRAFALGDETRTLRPPFPGSYNQTSVPVLSAKFSETNYSVFRVILLVHSEGGVDKTRQ